MAKVAKPKKEISMEEALWKSADKLRGSVEPAEYKHVVLSLFFLKFASDKFDDCRNRIIANHGERFADMKPFYTQENVFYLPEESRWSYIMANAKQDDIALKIDTALYTIEKNNPSLKGALPDNYYSRLHIDTAKLASLLDEINKINTDDKENDIIGRVYEYFLSKFALAEGKGKGEFYTPKCIVNTVFEVIDEKELIPEYLMLWFSRPEFDRYARFKSHGSVREVMDWDEMCKVKLPVPSYEEQKQIVEGYKTITERISLKKQVNDNLEATAHAIYKNLFVENVDMSDLPEDWFVSALGDVAELSAGGDRSLVYSDFPTEGCSVPIFSNGIDEEGLYGFTDKAKIFEESVTVSARGTVGYVFLREEPYVPIVRLISVIPNTKYVTAKYIETVFSLIPT